jgi:hypothetical protein
MDSWSNTRMQAYAVLVQSLLPMMKDLKESSVNEDIVWPRTGEEIIRLKSIWRVEGNAA